MSDEFDMTRVSSRRNYDRVKTHISAKNNWEFLLKKRVEVRHPKTQKPTPKSGLLLENYAGDHLISHTLSRAVPSAQRGLTSVFGMGTGGTLAVWSPANLRRFIQHVTPLKTWTALGRLFLLQPDPIYGLFLPDKKRQTGATQPNISQRNRLVYYRAC